MPERLAVRADGAHLEAVVEPDGGVRITGQDVSNGVLENDEFSSYEWSWRVAPADVPGVIAVLEGEPGEDVAAVIDRWMAANPSDPGMAISRAGIPITFESRMGER